MKELLDATVVNKYLKILNQYCMLKDKEKNMNTFIAKAFSNILEWGHILVLFYCGSI